MTNSRHKTMQPIRFKTLFALVAAMACGCATTAFAQSSVTIYGRLNESIENQKVGTGTAKWVEQNNSSRLGFRGTKDLGGGLKAGSMTARPPAAPRSGTAAPK